MKWLCWLGLHKWYSDSRYLFWDPPVPAYCDRCGKTRGGYGTHGKSRNE